MDEQNKPIQTEVLTPTPVEQQPEAPAKDPGMNMAIVGLVFAVLVAIVGLVLCILARNKSKAAGFNNKIASIGIVVAILNMIFGVYLSVSNNI